MNKIVFFGGGQMALGMLKGLIRDEILPAENIVVCEKVEERRSFLEDTLGVKAMEDASPELAGADMAVIAVNPWQVESVTAMMKSNLDASTIVLSIASGSPIKMLEEQLGEEVKIVRVLPNTMIEVKTGYSAVVPSDNITEDDTEIINQFVSVLGQVMYIEEDMFQAFAAYSGPGPMWAFKFIEAMIDAGVNSGFSREDSRKMTLMNVKGAAEVLLATGEHPAARVDRMTSPGGLTIEGIKILEEQGFGGVIMDSVEAAVKKGLSV